MGAPTGPNGRVATADTSAGTIRIRHTGRPPANPAGAATSVSSGLFDWLEAELDSVDVEAPALPFDFRLGWVGYLGYELKAEVGSSNRHHSDLPDASLMFLDRAVVIDHEGSRIYLLALEGLGSSPADAETWCAQSRAAIQDLASDTPLTPQGLISPGPETPSPTRRLSVARHSRSEYRERHRARAGEDHRR